MLFVASQALSDDTEMPLGYRNLFRAGRDPIPEGIHVLDLILDRKVIEAGRSGREGLSMSRMIARLCQRFVSDMRHAAQVRLLPEES